MSGCFGLTSLLRFCAFFFPFLILLSLPENPHAQIVLNEIQITNDITLADEDGDFGDWIELYNTGYEAIQLQGWSLSDDPEYLEKWSLPPLTLQPSEHQLVFASGKNRALINPIEHYETPIYPWSTFSYLLPQQEPPAAWRLPGFDASGWLQGSGSIGTGDDDDGTDIGPGHISVYSRIAINLNHPEEIVSLFLFADYDDAFVAYLNGHEIARVGIGVAGFPPAYDQPADQDHEAAGYQDLPYDGFIIEPSVFQSAVLDGENIFSFQVHNISEGSSDLTGNFLVAMGMSSSLIQTEAAPEWTSLVSEQLNLHSNFTLSSGESVYLSFNNAVVDYLGLPDMQLGHSIQRSSDGNSSWCITDSPTPDMENSPNCFVGYAPEPLFTLGPGLYDSAIEVGILSPDPLCEIRYTLDGSIPDEGDLLYSGPLTLNQTLTLSARCFSSELLPSAVEKNTYLINETDIGLPIVSLSIDPNDLWDPVTGIHVLGPDYDPNYPFFGANFWEDWERQGYVEYYDQNHVLQFEGGIGLKIHGGWSRGNEQKSFRVQCKDEYGLESMDYPLLPDKPFISSFKGFNLRNGGNDYWGYRFHDALMQRSMRETHADYMAYAPVIVFLNGEYWGFMEMREILDQNWVEENHGINNNEVTVISYKGALNVISGNENVFYTMYDYVTTNNPVTSEYFDSVSTMIDIENYVDYIIAETYWCNGDWSSGWSNNTKFWHHDAPNGKWRFMLMDMDFGMGLAGNSPYDDYISLAGDDWFHTDQIFNRLIQNSQFRTYFINRYADLMNTAFQPDYVNALADSMRNEILPVFARHCARWNTDSSALQDELNGRLQWNQDRIPGSRYVVEDHFSLVGQVTISLDVQPAGAGRIHISTIEPGEVEYPWSGVYYNGVPLRITVIENPGYHFDHWGINGLFEVENDLRQFTLNFEDDESFIAYFTGEPVEPAMQISEVMYNDDNSNESGDWIEIHNLLEIPLNLSGMTFGDDNYFHRFEIPLNTLIEGGDYVVLARDTSLFYSQYPDSVRVSGPFIFGLGNDSDVIRIMDHRMDTLVLIDYSDEFPWPGNSDGTGRTMEFDTTATDQNQGNSWFSGCLGGSPGGPFDVSCGVVTSVENSAPNGWSVWPNPTEQSFYISFSDEFVADVQVMNALGSVVYNHSNGRTAIREIDCSSWESGIYIVRAISSGSERIMSCKVAVR